MIFQDLYVKYFGTKVPPIISAAGIVHDIGKIIMLQIFGDDYYNQILSHSYQDDGLLQKEQEIYGIDHAIIGGYFLNWWAFPYDIIEMTLYHHTPNDPDISNKKQVALMCLASQIDNNMMENNDMNFKFAMDVLNVNGDFLKDILDKYKQ